MGLSLATAQRIGIVVNAPEDIGQPRVLIALRAAKIATAVAVGGGTLIGVPIAIWIAILNDISSLGDAAILVGCVWGLYIAVTVPVIVGVAVPLSLVGIRQTYRTCAAIFGHVDPPDCPLPSA
jgi:hypothetical protein